jgi:sulfoxide reductase heme-binding subunit YedZ
MALWELIRASGLVAYVLLTAGVAMGVSVKVRALDWVMKRAWVNEAHQTVSVLALAFTLLHAVAILFNGHAPFTVTQVLVPFSATWRPFAAAMGSVSMWLVGLLVVSSWARSAIGYKTWRAIHFSGFAAWVLAVGHGITAGADSGEAWVQYLYLGSGALVGLLCVFRFLDPQPEKRPAVARVEAVAVGGTAVD